MARQTQGDVSSSTRGIIAGGQNPAYKNEINFITISTLGNAADFGDLTVARRTLVGGSNAIRGLFAGGQDTNPNADANSVNVIDYITIASLGDATDFGDLTGGATDGKRNLMSPGCSPTRCVWILEEKMEVEMEKMLWNMCKSCLPEMQLILEIQ